MGDNQSKSLELCGGRYGLTFLEQIIAAVMRCDFRRPASGFLAGVCISIGATANLMCENKYVGAFLFCVGLILVRKYKLSLFTGMVRDFFEMKHPFELILVLSSNVLGTICFAVAIRNTSVYDIVYPRISTMCLSKAENTYISLLILSMLCNTMINIAIDSTEQTRSYDIETMLLGVSIFVLCGFEHCVADAFYFALSGLPVRMILSQWLTITIGNFLGGVISHEMMTMARESGMS